ncbi:MAG TPA: serine/threonine-protein kinase [Bryobacteraceae bacterium]|nr:serine/threonine-protein kinase [Bryobacteraceae bacterium]
MGSDEKTELNPATQLGPYQIIGPLGAGGMGKVYKAHDPRLNRAVAIKVSARRYSDGFEKEARAVAALNHPHICTLYDIGPDYLVMEYIEGQTLRHRLGGGALPVEGVLEYGAQIADALAEAHAHGVIHRDLKPANIMVTKNGVKVLDFGIARVIPAGDNASTMTVGLEGTPGYMAPEQAAGGMAGPSADLFSLGLILYEMTTGRLPAPGVSLGATLASGAEVTIPPLGRSRKHLPAGLEALVTGLLEADPARRPPSALDVKAKLLRLKRGSHARVRQLAIAGVLAAVLGAAWAFFRSAPHATVSAPKASIAVLPFVNKTGDANLDYVVDGATSDLIRRLAMVPQLRVISTRVGHGVEGKRSHDDRRRATSWGR